MSAGEREPSGLDEAPTEEMASIPRPRPVSEANLPAGRIRPSLRAVFRALLLLALTLGAATAFFVIPPIVGWWERGVALADQHTKLLVAHPGWSFPARIVTAPVSEKEAIERKLYAAKLAGYAERCPKPGPGEYCAKAGLVMPRAGGWIEGVELGRLVGPDGEIREHLPLEEAPKHLLDAIVAAEDRSFYDHFGVDLVAMGRATLANFRGGGYVQGGSTLTMQVARALTQEKERTLSRKIREAVIAAAVDAHLGKRGVLGMYLDAPYLGQDGGLSVCGFRAASKHYFGKDAGALSLAEAATLAAILPAPGRLAPDRAPKEARERRDRVLRAMAEMGYDIKKALDEPLRTVQKTQPPERFAGYVSAVRAALEATLPPETLYGAGLVVIAGVDPWLQNEAEHLFPEKAKYLEGLVGATSATERLQAAAIVLDVADGRVRAVYGGQGITSTDFNRATQARRQAGSAFKPVVYAHALSQKDATGKPSFTAASAMPNAPRVFKTPSGDWRPRNVGGEYSETACLAHALAWSQNIATASLLEAAGGPKALVPFAQKLGFDTRRFPEELGLALGQAEVTPLELAELAATIAAGGLRVAGRTVLSAKDALGTERWPVSDERVRVLEPGPAAIVRELMRLVVDGGTGGTVRGVGEAGVQGPVLGKTGTTDSEKDLWFIGATPKYAGVVWLGYDTPRTIGGTASDLAAPLWGWWMRRATKLDGPPAAFSTDPTLTRRWICTVTGKIAGPSCQGINAPFMPGTEPKQGCNVEHPAHEPDPAHPKYESLWRRLAREREEAAAQGVAP
ncbi:MAG: transglycosylase domain-containing protein [Deltaproteobacteria bacterium]|nr:transglycosylase domain-containing protein [Deltaproteobacteria bacterium]